MRSVREQLEQFRKSMEADGAAQRSECRRLVSTAVRRAGWLVDEVLQVMPCFPGAVRRCRVLGAFKVNARHRAHESRAGWH